MQFGLRSLNARYLLAVSLLIVFIVGTAIVVQLRVIDSSQSNTANVQLRNEIMRTSSELRNAIWHAEFSLRAYSLLPTDNHRENFRQHIADARHYTEVIQRLSLHDERITRFDLNLLADYLAELKSEGEHFFRVRVDLDNLFPSTETVNSKMIPARMRFNTAVDLALLELRENGDDNSALNALLQDIRINWSRTISSFRIYISNRVGVFGDPEAGMSGQLTNIESYLDQNDILLQRLAEFDERDELGLQTADSLQEMTQASLDWRIAFYEVASIYRSDAWRSDLPLMTRRIQPLFVNIWERLRKVDSTIEALAGNDIVFMSKEAQQMATNLWLLAGLVIMFIVLGYLYLQSRILSPISVLTEALREQAHGVESESLPQTDAVETRNLVEAFTEMRRQVRDRQVALDHHSLHDPLTGLPNRTQMLGRLAQVIRRAEAGERWSLIILNLNNFKEINDSLGHSFGDKVLAKIARRLSSELHNADIVAHLGGDAFSVVVNAADGIDTDVETFARRLAEIISRRMKISKESLHLTAALGVASYPEDGDESELLMQRAEIAMYEAKHKKSGISFYSSDNDRYRMGRFTLVNDLRNAIEENALELYFQPKVSLGNGQLLGVESLLRWNHPKRGSVPPEEIIIIAERTGQIDRLSEWLLEAAIKQCARWNKAGYDLHVGVNLSTWNLQAGGLPERIGVLLAENNVRAEQLTLEVTESAMMLDMARAIEILRKLDKMGIYVSVDDFGTGFSSLSYLKRLPVKELKIDKSFVIDMQQNENDRIIVKSTIDLAHNLGLRVVAEGVESEVILRQLEILGCDVAQGFHICRPLPEKALLKWLVKTGSWQRGNAASA